MSEERDQKSPAGSVAGSGPGGANPQVKPGDVLKAQAAAEPKPLTAAEQMALYEEKLKEDDWGHQPC